MKTLIILSMLLVGCATTPKEQTWETHNLPNVEASPELQKMEDEFNEDQRNHEVTKALYEINNSIIRNTIYGR